jgi:hypothetical protein
MKYLIVLLLLASVAMPITLQYDDFVLGEFPGPAHSGVHAYGVWYDLDSLGYSNFLVDSVEIAFRGRLAWKNPWFYIEFWQDIGAHNLPDVRLWQSEMQVAGGGEDPEWAPFIKQYAIDYTEPLDGHIWVVIREVTQQMASIVGQETGYGHARRLIGETTYLWGPSSYDNVMRLIGDTSALEQSTWANIKAQF